MPEKNITFEIREYLGVISRHDSGWNKELNVISWNGQPPKYDLRDWDPHHERMSRGITLYPGEMRKLVDLYLAGNSRKAVEEGQETEARRYKRQAEYRKSYAEKKQDPTIEAAEADALEGAIPPEQEAAEGETQETAAETAAPAGGAQQEIPAAESF